MCLVVTENVAADSVMDAGTLFGQINELQNSRVTNVFKFKDVNVKNEIYTNYNTV